MNNKIKVLYLVNSDTTTSIPLEVSKYMNTSDVELVIAAYYGSAVHPKDTDEIKVLNFGAGRINHFGAIWRFIKLLRNGKFDVIHLHHTFSALIGAILSGLFGVAVVKTEHNDHRFYKFYQHMMNAITLPLCDLLLCNSDNTRQSFNAWEKLTSIKKARVVYNGSDFSRIDQHINSTSIIDGKYNEEGVVFGCVGRLVQQKNYERLLKGFATLEGNSTLVVIGGGVQERYLRELVCSFGLEGSVILTGSIPREEVYAILGKLDVFVIASLWEGFCNAAVEGMSAYKPILLSDISTLREVVGDHALGYFDPLSVDSISEALNKTIQQGKVNLKKTGKATAVYARGKYSIEKTAMSYIDAYKEVTKK